MAGNREFGALIRRLREKKRKNDPTFSLRQFAAKIGISPTFLSKIETGDFNPPAPDKIKRMAELLDVDADELLALAGRVDPDLPEIIQTYPKAMANFLRTARELELSEEDIEALTRRIRKRKK